MRRISAVIILTVLLALNAATVVAAQAPAASFAELRGRIRPGQTVIVYAVPANDPSTAKVIGQVEDLSAHTLRLLVDGRTRELAESEVRVVAETYKTRRKCALIGLWAGAVLGLINVGHWCHAGGDPDSCANATGALVMWTGLGAAVGAASAARQQERVLFRAPREP